MDVEPGLADAARTQGWEAALFEYSKRMMQRGMGLVEDPRTADWVYMLPGKNRGRALLLGAGFGAASIALSDIFQEVVAGDTERFKIDFLQVRAEQQGIRNLTPVHIAAASAFPFPDGHFDLVAVDGLRWTARDLRFSTLARLAGGLLRPGGSAFFTVGNRLSAARLLGTSRACGRRLHTFHGYGKALRKAGFSGLQSFACIPYAIGVPSYYIPMASDAAFGCFFKKMLPRFAMLSPEVKRARGLEYGFAAMLLRLASAWRLGAAAKFLVPGFGLMAVKPPRAAAAA